MIRLLSRRGVARAVPSAVAAVLLGWAHDAAGQRAGGEDGPSVVAPTWHAGVETGRLPALRLGWETHLDDWIFGAATGLGPGSGAVDARFTPTIRLGRRLPAGFRLDAGLGFELARREGGGNANESEIQWELTGAWSAPSGWRAEAGVRGTDYRQVAWEPLVRVSAPGALLGTPLPMPEPRAQDRHRFGAPRPVAEAGRLDLAVRAPGRRGSGALLAASNPRGDPDPWRGGAGRNVDRLGIRADVWAERGPVAAWARWSSDLHTDPSIAARVGPVAEGARFPVTVSFSGGATWSDLRHGNRAELGARHDPKVFLWMPHLGEERTARVRALSAEAHVGRVALSATQGALDAIEGRSVEPLEHVRLEARSRGSWSVGIEHERMTRDGGGSGVGGRTRSATRMSLSRRGALRGRLAAGSDVVLRIGVGSTSNRWRGASPWTPASAFGSALSGPVVRDENSNHIPRRGFWGSADVELRSAPALLDYEALLGRGWMVPGGAEEEGAVDDPVATAGVSAGWGPLGLEAAAGWGLSTWTGEGMDRGDGGRVDAVLAGTMNVVPGRGHVRLRLGEWGPAPAWWREEATLEGHLSVPLLVGGAGELGVELHGRSALHGARSGLHERGGIEATLALALPLPTGPLGWAGRAEARIEDVFDRGLPMRVGAPARGRRLTVLVLLLD